MAGSSSIQCSRRTLWLTNNTSHALTLATRALQLVTIARLPAFLKATSRRWPNASGRIWTARMSVVSLLRRWPVAVSTPRIYASSAHRCAKHAQRSVKGTNTSIASNALKHAARALASAGRWVKLHQSASFAQRTGAPAVLERREPSKH